MKDITTLTRTWSPCPSFQAPRRRGTKLSVLQSASSWTHSLFGQSSCVKRHRIWRHQPLIIYLAGFFVITWDKPKSRRTLLSRPGGARVHIHSVLFSSSQVRIEVECSLVNVLLNPPLVCTAPPLQSDIGFGGCPMEWSIWSTVD